MKKILILSLMLISALFCFSQEKAPLQPYISIYSAAYEAEMNANYQLALKELEDAFQSLEQPYYKHLKLALDLSLKLNDLDRAHRYLEKLFLLGVPMSELLDLAKIETVLKPENLSSDKARIDSLHSVFFSNCDNYFLNEVIFMKGQDELLRPYWKEDCAKKIMKETYLKNLTKIKSMIARNGGLNALKLGYYYDYLDILLIHGISSLKDENELSYWKNTLKIEVNNYSLLPRNYSGYFDMADWRSKNFQVFGSVYSNFNGTKQFSPEIIDIKNVDQRRLSIGLEPLWKYAAIIGIELPKEYEKN